MYKIIVSEDINSACVEGVFLILWLLLKSSCQWRHIKELLSLVRCIRCHMSHEVCSFLVADLYILRWALPVFPVLRFFVAFGVDFLYARLPARRGICILFSGCNPHDGNASRQELSAQAIITCDSNEWISLTLSWLDSFTVASHLLTGCSFQS